MKTRKKLCASCLNFNLNKTLKVNKKQHPKWLDKINYVKQFIEKYNNFLINYPKNFNNKSTFYVGKKWKNRKILYWAAKPSGDEFKINHAKKAYGSFSNSGVAQIDKYGFVDIKLHTPQNYKTIEKNKVNSKTYFKHLHFVISNNNNDSWNNQIYTKLIHNNYNSSDFLIRLRSKKYVILNVLPCNIYAKDHIPDTYNLPYKNIKNMSIQEINNWFSSLINLQYPIIEKFLKYKKLELYEIPIICYCAHNKCNASKIAYEHLLKKGFINVSLYEDGLKGYKDSNK